MIYILFIQERSMAVTGGITWWKDFICVGCYNMLDQRDEVGDVPSVPSSFCVLNIH